MTRKAIAIGMLAALGVLAPLVAHLFGAECWVYLPAHYPALLAGLALGPLAGVIVAGATVLSDLTIGGRLTGAAFLPVGAEILVYGVAAGAFCRPNARWTERLSALVIALLLGRLVYLGVGSLAGQHPRAMLAPLFAGAWPGIWIQLLTLPFAAHFVEGLARPARSAETPPAATSGVESTELSIQEEETR